MKKIFTLFAAAMLAFGASADEPKVAVLSWDNGTRTNAEVNGEAGTDNCMTYEDGFKIVL